jgi:hypothetical protein
VRCTRGVTSGTPGPETLASPHRDDDPARTARARRRAAALAAVAVAAVLAALLWLPRPGGSDPAVAPTRTSLPPEPVGALLVLRDGGERAGQVTLDRRRAVVEIECLGPGSVFVRLNARSWLSRACTEGALRRAARLVTTDMLERLDPGLGSDVRVTVSTVSTTETTRWRVSLSPPLGPVR